MPRQALRVLFFGFRSRRTSATSRSTITSCASLVRTAAPAAPALCRCCGGSRYLRRTPRSQADQRNVKKRLAMFGNVWHHFAPVSNRRCCHGLRERSRHGSLGWFCQVFMTIHCTWWSFSRHSPSLNQRSFGPEREIT